MSEISFTGNKLLKSINKEWCKKFPYTYLNFYTPDGKSQEDWNVTLASIRAKKEANELSTNAGMKVSTFERRYMETFGSRVEIMYKKNGRHYRSLGDLDNMTLNEFNKWCKNNGAAEIMVEHPEWF